MAALLLLLVLSGAGGSAVQAQIVPGSLDTSFANGGTCTLFSGGTFYAQASGISMGGGVIYLIGSSYYGFHEYNATVFKIRSDGSRDPNFGSGTGVFLPSSGGAHFGDRISQHPERGLIIATRVGAQRQLLRLLPYLGEQDTSFGTSGIFLLTNTSTTVAVDVQSDGKILVLSTEPGTRTTLRLRRLSATGVLDTSFGSGGSITINDSLSSVTARSLVLLDDDRIAVGAIVHSSPNAAYTARYLSTGAPDSTYGTGGVLRVTLPSAFTYAGALAIDGKGLAVATQTAASRLNLASTLGSSLNLGFSGDGLQTSTNTYGTNSCMAFRADGKIFAGVDTAGELRVVACGPNGVFDTAFGPEGRMGAGFGGGISVNSTMAVATQPDGKILVMGHGRQSGETNFSSWLLMRFHTDGVPAPPEISGHPLSKTVQRNSSVSFTVTPTPGNTVTPTYQWKRNNSPINYATSATYTINSAQITDEGTLTVDVMNAMGTATSDPATLTVVAPPLVSTPPTGVSASHGPVHDFTVTVSGRTPLTYQWRKDGQPYDVERVSSSLTDTLSVAIEDANEGAYSVDITNTDGTTSTTPVNLVALLNPPLVQSSPGNASITSSGSASVSLTVTVTGLPPFTYQWQKSQQNHGSAVVSSGYTHTLVLPADVPQSGQYRCVITNADGSATSGSATVNVIASPPNIQAHPQEQIAIADGTGFALSITVTGRSPYTFRWRKNNETIGTPLLQSTGYSTLNLTRSDATSGTYDCVVTNADGTAASNPALLFFRATGTLALRTPRVLVNDGVAVTLQADLFSSQSALSHQWQFNGRNITGANSEVHSFVTTLANAGAYRLRVGTLATTFSSDIGLVTVVEKTARTVVVAEGKAATLAAKVAGDQTGLSFLWRRIDGLPVDSAGGFTGQGTAVLKIPKAEAAKHETIYECQISRVGTPASVITGQFTLAIESAKPVVETLFLSDGWIAETYEPLQLTATHSPTRFNVSGLPSGLTCDPATGVISGTPAKPGDFKVKISATNPLGTSAVITADLKIAALDRGMVGKFSGLVTPGSGVYVGTCSVTISESGRFTGRGAIQVSDGLRISVPLNGQFQRLSNFSYNAVTEFTLRAYDSESGPVSCLLFLECGSTGSNMRAQLQAEDNHGYHYHDTTRLARNPWNARTNPATSRAGYHTMALDQVGVASDNDAAGSGYASCTVTTGGTLTLAGRLPDGSAFTIPSFIDDQGTMRVFAAPRGRDLLGGEITVRPGTAPAYRDIGVGGNLRWIRSASTLFTWEPVTNAYFNGVDRDLTVAGARYLAPNIPFLTSPYMLNVSVEPPGNLVARFTGFIFNGGAYRISLGTSHVATFPPYSSGDTVRFGRMTFSPGTGVFSGAATYYFFDPDTGRVEESFPTTYRGIVTRSNPAALPGRGAGHFARNYTYYIYDPDYGFVIQRLSLLTSGGVYLSIEE